MKKLLLSMAVVGMLFTACNGKKTEEHGHADGEEHANHETDTISQEEFKVGTDTISSSDAHGHEHKSGEKHEH